MEPTSITTDPAVRWGTPCLRDTGVSVAHVVSLWRAGYSDERVLEACPALTAADLDAASEWYSERGDYALGPQPPPPGTHPRVAVDRRVQGGQPVVRGTRVTVEAICGLRESGRTVAEIVAEYPGLTADDVTDAIAYDAGVRT